MDDRENAALRVVIGTALAMRERLANPQPGDAPEFYRWMLEKAERELVADVPRVRKLVDILRSKEDDISRAMVAYADALCR